MFRSRQRVQGLVLKVSKLKQKCQFACLRSSGTVVASTHVQTEARALSEDEVVVSGFSGRFPESDNVAEFRDNLINGRDMVTDNNRRWEPGVHGLPSRNGKLKDISKFDASFFGVHPKQANGMDPQLRLLLEVSYEALVDAGINPQTVRGSRTGVFIGCSASEAHNAWSADAEKVTGYEMTGCTRSMFANRLSYFFDFKGPSYAIDTACSSSLLALDQALRSIRTGQCDAAIVGGTNLCLQPSTSAQFNKLNMLSSDGVCKAFDATGAGYVRSEAIVAVYLQKKSTAKRVYASLVHSKTNSDGFKVDGITFPSGEMQKRLLNEVYQEAGVDPSAVSYFELHGTGTQAGDPQEANSVADVCCGPNRQTPLLVGSTKSNMGHPEPASGLAALAKVLISMHDGVIPPNLHFRQPNPKVPALTDGRFKVVDKLTSWKGGYAGISSFGFGGSNVHVLLRSAEKPTTPSEETGSVPVSAASAASAASAKQHHPAATVPRLVTVAGRTKEGVEKLLQEALHRPDDVQLQALLESSVGQAASSTHPYRGFALVNSPKPLQTIEKVSTESRPVWFVFSGMGTQWPQMGKDLMELEIFRNSIMRSDAALKSVGLSVYDLIMNSTESTFNEATNSFVGLASIQMALVDVLRSLGVNPDGILGHSVGELGCAYADGAMTAEETVQVAYWRGRSLAEANLPLGGMAAVGMTWEEAQKRCPKGIVPACHNSHDTVTISGPAEDVARFVAELQKEGIFAKEVDSAGNAFHSYFMEKAAPNLRRHLEKILAHPKPRSSRWISTSVAKPEWGSELARAATVDYWVNNLVSPVLFQDALGQIPSNAIVVEIAPHSLLQAVLRRGLSSGCSIVGLMDKRQPDNHVNLLQQIGKLHLTGLNFNPLALYPPVELPVSPETPMISSLVRWDHSDTWEVPTAPQFLALADGASGGRTAATVDIDIAPGTEDEYIAGHVIDGRILYPATGYLVLAWKQLAKSQNQKFGMSPVAFEDVSIHRATIIPPAGAVKLDVSVTAGTGRFEVCDNGALVASGKVYFTQPPQTQQPTDGSNKNASPAAATVSTQQLKLNADDVYKELRLRGYDYGKTFKGILSVDNTGTDGELSWNGNWVPFLDAMLQMQVFSHPGRDLRLPTRLRYLRINPQTHEEHVRQGEQEGLKVISVHNNQTLGTCTAGGVELLDLHATAAPRRHGSQPDPMLETYQFVPYDESNLAVSVGDLTNYSEACTRLAVKHLQRLVNGNDKLHIGLMNGELTKILLKNMPGKSQPLDQTAAANFLDRSIYKTLLKLTEIPHDSKFIDGSKTVTSAAVGDIFNDKLTNFARSDRMFKTCMDVVLENLSVEGSETSLKIVELEAGIGQAYRHAVSQLATQPGVTVNYVAAAEPSSLSNISADLIERFRITPVGWSLAAGSSKSPVPETVSNADLVIATDVLHRQTDLVAALSSASNLMKPGGFLLFVEPTKNFALPWSLGGLTTDVAKLTDVSARTFGPYCDEKTWTKLIGEAGLEPIARKSDGLLNTVFLARKLVAPPVSEPVVMEVEDRAFSWLEHVKGAMESEEVNGGNRDSVWLRAERSPTNGIVGMINCLRREPNGHRLRCLYNASCGFNQSVSLPEDDLQAVYKKDLVMNVYRSGQWGSFRHMPLESGHTLVNTDKAYINVLTRGDLSSLRWIESPVKYFNPLESPDKELCHVAYTALNFRDIMLATGKLPPDAIPGDLASQDCLLGMEFSGHDAFGRRVMGLLAAKGLATVVDAPRKFLWQVPDGWTLEQAATVPVAYSTAYYSLMVRGGLRRGETVLIHSGSGAVGQAAISIALNHGCRVLTTVGSMDKRANLRQRFPQLDESSFADSRDPEFWRTILQSTNGRGVDVVLNSLAEDKLQSSVQLLAQHGRFLEIGKFDLSNNSPLGMAVFLRNVSFHGILLDSLFEPGNPDWQTVYDHVSDGIKSGVVQPLPTTVYGHDDVENAFRFMAQGKHIGKVLIKVQDEADVMSGKKLVIPAVARTVCNPRRSFVIIGGLGGFGLEMAGWLVERGARHLVLTSRGGIRTGYQERRVREMRDAGVDVQVSTRNVSDPNEAMALIGEAATIPGVEGVGGVFNLAVVLEDGLTANQTTEQWIRATQPKVAGTENLDAATRKLCGKTLDWFVVFSSVSCGRGNAGQANYGFANSVMERICEQRRSEGLAGQAIQWGAIGDVGVAFDLLGGNQDASIGGTLPQRINSCLATLDSFLSRPEAVVSSFVLAETSRGRKSEAAGAGGASLRDSVAHILGIKDPTSVNVDATLGDLGLDSLMGVEIKQTLERNFDITLSAKEIRALTFARLDELSSGKPKTESGTEASISQPVPSANIRYQLKHLMPTEEMVKMNSYEGSAETPVFVITPIDGSVLLLESIMSRVNVGQVYGLQCTESTPLTSVADMANEYIKRMKAVSPTGPYRIIGYSFGASVAIEMALQLQQQQSVVSKLVLLDGSQSFVSAYTARTRERLTIGVDDTNTAETTAICAFIMQTAVRLAEDKEAAKKIDIVKLAGDLMQKADWRSRVDHTVQLLVDAGIVSSDAKPTLTAAVTAFYRKLEVSEKYQPTSVLSPSTQVTLIRAADNTVQRETLGDDYSLRNVTSGDITVHVVNGSHETFILTDEGVASVSPLINAALS